MIWMGPLDSRRWVRSTSRPSALAANASAAILALTDRPAALPGDIVLKLGDTALKLHEIGVGLQVGILFGDGEERAQRAGHHVVRLGLFGRRRGPAVGVAGLDDRLQGLLLILHVALARL